MPWECLLPAAACFALVVASYFLVRHHAKVDGNAPRLDFERAYETWKKGQHGLAVLFAAIGFFKLMRPALIGALGTMSTAMITAICGGITFEQVERLSCIWGEVFSGRKLEMCRKP